MNVRGVFLIHFIVYNWILLKKENVTPDPKIRVVRLVGATNWTKWKWQMNMHFEHYVMMSITDRVPKCPYIQTLKRCQKIIKIICGSGTPITDGRQSWSRVGWVRWLCIWYWRTVTQRTFGTISSVLKNKEIFNDWACWRRISSSSSLIQKWTLLCMLLQLRSYSRTWIQSYVDKGCMTYRLNCYMGRSWQQWDLSTRSLATSGSRLMTTSEQWTVCLRNCVWPKKGSTHSSRVKCIHSTCINHVPISGTSKQLQVNQVGWRSQQKTIEKTAGVFTVGRLGIWKRNVRNWKLKRINQRWQIRWVHCQWTIRKVQHF